MIFGFLDRVVKSLKEAARSELKGVQGWTLHLDQ
jgi:hypothetical protein